MPATSTQRVYYYLINGCHDGGLLTALQNSAWTAAAPLATVEFMERMLQQIAGLEVSLRRPRTPPAR
eukprot:COSAG01_NODE_3675_length_5804_cov_4.926919_6_plen_67_part_00